MSGLSVGQVVRAARMLVFPALQIACFGAAVLLWPGKPGLALVALAGACLALCFALHITYHEWGHQGHPGGLGGELAISGLIGMPLDGYRWHHQNHHQHENAPADFSTTWASRADGAPGVVPQGALGYALGWPRQLARSARAMRARDLEGSLPAALGARVRRQKRALAALIVALVVLSPAVAAAWFAMVYGGWVLVALHNYGQHPPVDPERAISTSYRAEWYNRVFCANGLHFEHHRDPGLPWDRLVPLPDAPRVERPHLFVPWPVDP